MLVKWDLNKRAIYVDEEEITLQACGLPVIKASVQDGKLSVQWLTPEWEQWQDLQEATEYKEIVDKANGALEAAKNMQSLKGSGKGPSDNRA